MMDDLIVTIGTTMTLIAVAALALVEIYAVVWVMLTAVL